MDPLLIASLALGSGVAIAGIYAARRIERLALRLGRVTERAAQAAAEVDRLHAYAKHLGVRPVDPADVERMLQLVVVGEDGTRQPDAGALDASVRGGAGGGLHEVGPQSAEPGSAASGSADDPVLG